jgi:hypothetical protein
MYFFADTLVNADPTADELADIALTVEERVRAMGIEPRIAMLSFASFGGSSSPEAAKMRRAAELVKAIRPEVVCDGEMQADLAIDHARLDAEHPFSDLTGPANILVFPNLEWPEGQPELAAYRCTRCSHLIPPHRKQWMLARGEWRAANPKSKIAGFWINQLYSPWKDWPETATEFLEAKAGTPARDAPRGRGFTMWTGYRCTKAPSPGTPSIPYSPARCGISYGNSRKESAGW